MTDLAIRLVNPLRFPLIHALLLLVAAAFLAGSINVGSQLNHSTARKTLASDAQYYKTVMQRFQTTYQALPGDINNASKFWRKCRHNIAECNGDGDGAITSGANDTTTESALAWQHLSISGYLNEKFSGDLIAGYYVPGQNIPKAPYEDSGYLITNMIPYAHASWSHPHFLAVGGTGDWRFSNPAVSLSDAMALDHKLDDGIASTGAVLAFSKDEHRCLDENNRKMLVGKDIAHYATHLSEDARCSVYFLLN